MGVSRRAHRNEENIFVVVEENLTEEENLEPQDIDGRLVFR
jgi:hypothetical protein